MPRARAYPRIALALLGLALAACSAADIAREREFSQMPREIRLGTADMVITRVEEDVSPAEVAAAVQGLVEQAPMCLSWPGLWLAAFDNRRNVYFARYDLMARDWGEDVATTNRARMQEFVDLGFLTARDRSDIGPGVVEYTLTEEGSLYLRGSPYGGVRPSFCPPAQRRLVEINGMEWGQYDCGSLRVRFTHVADDWPTWARTEGVRTRIAATMAPVGQTAIGSVTLGRQWFRIGQLPGGFDNGSLRSVCFDDSRQNVLGNDLNLNVAPASSSP